MRKLFAVLTVVVSTLAFAEDKPAPQKAAGGLSQPYSIAAGDMAALYLGQFFAASRVIDAPVVAVYSRELKKIVVLVIGSRDSIDGAKGVLEELRGHITKAATLFQGQFGLTLAEDDHVLVYTHKTKGEIVRRDAGKYVSP